MPPDFVVFDLGEVPSVAPPHLTDLAALTADADPAARHAAPRHRDHPAHADHTSCSGFTDPDRNGWVLQERGSRA